MEPSTPPRSSRSRELPDTPATPRFGSFGDLQDHPRKPQDRIHKPGPGSAQPQALRTPHHRRKRSLNVLATPRQTPRKRRAQETGKKEEPSLSLLDKFNAPMEEEDEEEHEDEEHTQAISSSSSSSQHNTFPEKDVQCLPPHPHQDAPPPGVPGMWYVFRGKKIFRPLPPGERPVEPVTLFKDEIENSRRRKRSEDIFRDEVESEADTDVEWDRF